MEKHGLLEKNKKFAYASGVSARLLIKKRSKRTEDSRPGGFQL